MQYHTKRLTMPACTAKKILAAGCTGFLMSMAGSLVDAKKAIYDYRPAEDFETEGRDCSEFSRKALPCTVGIAVTAHGPTSK